MPEECKPSSSQSHTTDRDYFTLWLTKLEQMLTERYSAQQDNILTAQRVINARLESMNEFRAQIKDQTSTFVTSKEVDLMVDSIKARIKDLEISKAVLESKASVGQVNNATTLSLAGLALGIVSLVVGLFIK